MTFEIEVGGRTRTIRIEPGDRPGRFRVTLEGVGQVIDAVPLGEHGVSLLRTVRAGQRTLTAPAEVHVVPAGLPGEVLVSLGGRTVGVTVNGRRSAGPGDAARHTHGEIALVAPMPGRVVRVLAAAGDDVAARQGVVVVEAMKMENELQAPRAGRIKEITVAAGASVDAGRVLAVIE